MLLEQAYRENRSNSVSLKKRKHEEKVKLLEEQVKITLKLSANKNLTSRNTG